MSNADVVATLYEAFGRGDLPTVLGLLDREVRWYEAEGSPYAARADGWVGPDAVVSNVFEKMGGDWASFTVHPARFHDAGAVVAVEGRYIAGHSRSGRTLDCQFCHVWTLDDGKVTKFQQYTDTAQFQDVMGPSEG
jgi:hypothetical protein